MAQLGGNGLTQAEAFTPVGPGRPAPIVMKVPRVLFLLLSLKDLIEEMGGILKESTVLIKNNMC